MGTTYQIKIINNNDITQEHITTKLKQINDIFSTWDKNSEISTINQAPINQWLTVSKELLFVLKTSQKIHQQTKGYFDITLGSLSQKLGFQNNYKNTNDYGQQYLLIKNNKIKKLKNIKVDLSAIAKGYGVDEIAKLIKSKNNHNFLVEIGGEVLATGLNQNKKQWLIGIENQLKSIRLNNQSIATSGNSRNYLIKNNKHYSHILNPKKAISTNNSLKSVSVIHSSTMIADAYATAIMAMPINIAKKFVKIHHLNVIFTQ
ncbi:Thiamin biosynthesis lipoprotein ApbE [hydrothermal vent metagenome]|uniref:FAD:protein FMN transferase n=1 Tax=hydrothermal vent metagenome TaxID=652676 RepID=A0A1W1C6G4_9ZZZZ